MRVLRRRLGGGGTSDIAGHGTAVSSRAWGHLPRGCLAELARPAAPAVTALLVDTPGIPAQAVRRVGDGAAQDTLRAASYQGRQGHPVLLGRAHWPGVAALAVADVGARRYLTAHGVTLIPCDDVADGTDVDRPPAGGA